MITTPFPLSGLMIRFDYFVIFNHSDRVLTEQEKFVLSRGLNFSIPPRKLNYVDFLISFELLHRNILEDPIAPASGIDKDFVKTRLKNIALSGYRNYTAPPFVFSSDEFKVLKNLKNDNSIFIIKPDKGNGVVISGVASGPAGPAGRD